MYRLSVVIVALNEAANLARTLESVSWADELVVVDSGSTDNTLGIAAHYGATVYQEEWKGYGTQVNSAIAKCAGPWILNLDADEVVTPRLASEIQALLRGEPHFSAYTLPRLNVILGKPMRHGGLYPDRKLRLFRKGIARLPEDEEPHSTPKTTSTVGRLREELIHHQYPSLELYIEHMNRYSSASTSLLLRRGKTSSGLLSFCWNVLVKPAWVFLYNYLFRGGFLDGREGFLCHLNHSLYVNWKYVKAWRANQAGVVIARRNGGSGPLSPDNVFFPEKNNETDEGLKRCVRAMA